jgi:tetratricopeptide (TPR) repeat protein
MIGSEDSLKLIVNSNSTHDSLKLDAINSLVLDYYLYTSPDSAEFYAMKYYEIAENSGLASQMAMALNTLGVIYMEKDDYLKAQSFFERSLNLKRELKDNMDIARTLNNLAILNSKLGNFSKAISYHNQSLALSEKEFDSLGIAQSLTNIAMLYRNSQIFDKALEYNYKSLEICKNLNHQNGLAINYNNLGIIYSEKNEHKKALMYFNQAQNIHIQLKNKQAVASTLANIGTIKQIQNKFDAALDCNFKSKRIYEEIKNKEGISGILINTGIIYLAQNKPYEAIKLLRRAYVIASEIGAKRNIAMSAKELFRAYKTVGNYKKALAMYERYVAVNDSIESDENRRELIHQEYKYKYLQIHMADSLKNAQAIELSKQRRMKELAVERSHRNLIIVLFMLLLIILGVIFRFRTIKVKTEKAVLLKEIELLKSQSINFSAHLSIENLSHQLNREKVNQNIDGTLNDTDWKVLTLLCSNPTINNREISEKIALSFEGVRSSLKKMYRIFNVQKSNENQRIALVVKVIQISNAK